jgi:hypothetical protein
MDRYWFNADQRSCHRFYFSIQENGMICWLMLALSISAAEVVHVSDPSHPFRSETECRAAARQYAQPGIKTDCWPVFVNKGKRT